VLREAIDGVKNAIAVRLFPAVSRSVGQFTQMIMINRRWLALRVEQAFKILAQALDGIFRIVKGVVDIFERIWKSGTTGKVIMIALGAVVAAMAAPWAVLAAAIALVAEDIELFISGHGKMRTVTGLLLSLFEMLGKKLNAILDSFFNYIVEGAKKLPLRLSGLAHAIANSIFGSPEEAIAAIGATPAVGPRSDSPLQAILRAMLPQPDYSALAPISPSAPLPIGLQNMLAPSIPFNVTINTAPGADGTKMAADFLTIAEPGIKRIIDDHWDTKMRETSAAASR